MLEQSHQTPYWGPKNIRPHNTNFYYPNNFVKKSVHPRLKDRCYHPNCKTTICTFLITNNSKRIKTKISVDINFMGYYISITLQFEIFQCSDPEHHWYLKSYSLCSELLKCSFHTWAMILYCHGPVIKVSQESAVSYFQIKQVTVDLFLIFMEHQFTP